VIPILGLLVVAPLGPTPARAQGNALVLAEAIRLEPQSVAQGKAVTLNLPALPAKPGQAIVLRFRAVILAAEEGGCNFNATVLLNDRALGRYWKKRGGCTSAARSTSPRSRFTAKTTR